MSKVNLTDRYIRTLQPDGVAQRDYWDDTLPSFGIRVTQNRKTWMVMYRFNGKQRRYTVGTYPILSLADAREKARAVLHRVQSGYDPAEEKIAARQAETFSDLAAEYLERHAKVKKKSWAADEYLINKEFLPLWKDKKIKDISRPDVRAVIDGVADRGARIQANRILALCRKMFNFGIERDLVSTNPCQGIKPPGMEQQRERWLNHDEIRQFWKALDQEGLPIRSLFRLRLLTAQRGAEVATMSWPDLDLETAWWTIPGSQTKNGLAHRVPLSTQAIEILKELQQDRERKKAKRAKHGGRVALKRRESGFVFPSPRRGPRASAERDDHPVRNIQKAIGRIRENSNVSFTGHDLRRTAASHMTSEGIERLVVGKILNHVERDITRVYDRHSYDREKRNALDWWGRQVEAIIKNETSPTVLTFAAKRLEQAS